MKKTVSVILCFVFFCTTFTFKAYSLGTSAQAHVLMDADSGIILSENNKDVKLKMASTTKILTALLALEEAEKNDKIVTFTENMSAEGSSMYLKAGDKLRLSDLAKGMMMASGNDAANAVALTLSENFEDFAKLMNARAEEIGMKNSSFVTPSGLDDDNHYSTALDMALLMAEALKNENFREISASKEEKVEFVYPQGKTSTYLNHNKLLSSYKYCTGGKTGYTKAAGRCLVTTAEKDGVTLVAVTLNAPDDWADHKALYEYGFSLYTQYTYEDTRVYNIKVSGGEEEFIAASADEAVLTLPACRINDIKKTVFLPQFIFAPVEKGAVVGKVIYTLDSKELNSTYIKAQCTIKEKTQPNFFVRLINAIFNRE